MHFKSSILCIVKVGLLTKTFESALGGTVVEANVVEATQIHDYDYDRSKCYDACVYCIAHVCGLNTILLQAYHDVLYIIM